MPKMNRLIRDYRNAGRGGTLPPRLDGFDKWLHGERDIVVENKLPDGAKESILVAIAPFSTDIISTTGPGQYTQVNMTAYGHAVWLDRITPAQLSSNQLGWQAPDPANKNISSKKFTPALLMLKVSRSGAPRNKNKVSGMTGQTYDYTPGRAPKIPFGRTLLTDDTDRQAQNTVLQDVDYEEAATKIKDILNEIPKETLLDFNFEPEILRIETKATKEFSAGLTSDVAVQ